jgi:hypothetical protein
MSFENIQEKFFNQLVELGLSDEKALEITSTFFFSWVQTIGDSVPSPEVYSKAVEEFLTRYKESL